jgi:hypothetical protein
MPPMPTKCTGPMSRGSFMNGTSEFPAVMPGFMPGIHVFLRFLQDVDGEGKSSLLDFPNQY